jgi:NAD(P)-dependent dehydrogenase (short-subunit alcohol dehydrogenase family)
MSRLTNQIALVTGSSRGIGAAIARLFAKEGAKVAVHGRDVEAMSTVCSENRRPRGHSDAGYCRRDRVRGDRGDAASD